jgi:hypothetical protein
MKRTQDECSIVVTAIADNSGVHTLETMHRSRHTPPTNFKKIGLCHQIGVIRALRDSLLLRQRFFRSSPFITRIFLLFSFSSPHTLHYCSFNLSHSLHPCFHSFFQTYHPSIAFIHSSLPPSLHFHTYYTTMGCCGSKHADQNEVINLKHSHPGSMLLHIQPFHAPPSHRLSFCASPLLYSASIVKFHTHFNKKRIWSWTQPILDRGDSLHRFDFTIAVSK